MNFGLRLTMGLASAALAFTGTVLIITGLNQDHQIKAQARTEHNRSQRNQFIENQLSQAEQELAESRYQNGCVFVQDQLTEGMQVLGATERTIVCDVHGLTAVTGPNGFIKDIARTPKKNVIQQRAQQ